MLLPVVKICIGVVLWGQPILGDMIGGRRSKLLEVLMTKDVQDNLIALNDMARAGLFSDEIDEVLSEGNPAGDGSLVFGWATRRRLSDHGGGIGLDDGLGLTLASSSSSFSSSSPSTTFSSSSLSTSPSTTSSSSSSLSIHPSRESSNRWNVWSKSLWGGLSGKGDEKQRHKPSHEGPAPAPPAAVVGGKEEVDREQHELSRKEEDERYQHQPNYESDPAPSVVDGKEEVDREQQQLSQEEEGEEQTRDSSMSVSSALAVETASRTVQLKEEEQQHHSLRGGSSVSS